ncbi:MAG: GNAT family N-acetyltransferase [Sedimentisphaerales bacterium]|nr:GNAT family N-acetyltransferase [Sedimentisphaerales bacterium]
MLNIFTVKTKEDIDNVKKLFYEYLAYLKKEFYEYADMAWYIEYYQSYENEIENLPGDYQLPKGCILLAKYDNEPVGCVALDEQSDGICEMKRLYIQPNYQREGVGTALCKALIYEAKKIGYSKFRLATALEPAKQLYKALGFVEIEPFDHVPVSGVIYMEIKLD